MDGLHHTPLAPLRIAVLSGGDSAEREISLQSGVAVAEGLRQRGHSTVIVDPATEPLESFSWGDVDVAFLALHGTFGEDGQAQQILEELQVVYTGSDSEASRVAFSKSAAKERFIAAGIPTPDYAIIHQADPFDHILEAAREIGFPVVVKPDAQGSSLGVVIVNDETQLEDVIEQCFTFDSFGIIEKAVTGSEWTLGVIDEEPLPLIRIGTDRGFFDYKDKYQDDATEYHFDHSVDPTVIDQITQVGIESCRTLGTRGVARVDMMVDVDLKPWVLEVNTIPGMTDHSLVPKAASRVGLSMGQLCELLVQRALAIGPRSLRKAS